MLSPPQSQAGGGKKEKREKKGTVWHDGSGGGKQLGQKAKEALDRSKVLHAYLEQNCCINLYVFARRSRLLAGR